MEPQLQTACEWTRCTNWRAFEDGAEGAAAHYQPGRVSVEYRYGAKGARVERVFVYTRHEDPRRRMLKEIMTTLSAQMRRIVARIVRENERSNGRFIASVLLPDGEVVHA